MVASRNIFFLVGLTQDRVAMVESIEQLRQLEYMLGQVRGFGSCNALVNDVGSL